MDTQRRKSFLDDAKVLSVLLGIVAAAAAMLLGAGRWFFDLQSKTDAKIAHEVLQKEIMLGDKATLEHAEASVHSQREEFKDELKEMRQEQRDSSDKMTRRLDRILHEVKK